MSTPQREFAVEVVQVLRDAGFESLWAGGCVRDSLLGREPEDYDVATDARPDDVQKLFRRTLNVGATFGVTIVLGRRQQGQVEVATFRADGEYLDGRRPKDVQFSSAEQDALRRDFTINGMFYDPVADRVIDYVAGQRDLTAGIVRAIGNPRERFAEDKLRLLRAVRFAAALGFELEPLTQAAVCEMAAQISVVSAERIAQELHKMLCLPQRAVAVGLLKDTGLLPVILPELDTSHEGTWQTTRHALDALPAAASFELAAATLLQSLEAGQAEQLSRRLRLSNKEIDAITWLVANGDSLRGARDFEPARLKTLLAHPLAESLIQLVQARGAATDDEDAAFCAEYLESTPADILNPAPLIGGSDLIAAGLQPGPEFKGILDAVRDAQLNGEIVSREDALALAKRIAAAGTDEAGENDQR